MSLRATSLSFGYDAAHPVLSGISLDLAPGEIVALQAPSGAGKSTLGRILAGHLQPQAGHVSLDDKPLPHSGFHPVQLIQQTSDFALDPRWRLGRSLTEAYSPDDALCRTFGISPNWLRRFPHEVSGGQLQRIAIVRALAPGLRYLVADEITGMLDPISQAEIWRALIAIAQARSIGILAITHDAALARAIASRIVTLAAT